MSKRNPDSLRVTDLREGTASRKRGKSPDIMRRIEEIRSSIAIPGQEKAAEQEKAANRQQIIDCLVAGLEDLQRDPKPNYPAKAALLKKAIMALEIEDIHPDRGKIQFLISTCVPNINRGRLDDYAASIHLLLAEDRKIDDVLMAIVSAAPQNSVSADFDALPVEGVVRAHVTDPDARVALGISVAGPETGGASGCILVEEELEFTPDIDAVTGMERGRG